LTIIKDKHIIRIINERIEMGVTLQEVIEHGGYDLTTKEDAIWLLSKQREFDELIEQAETLVEKEEENE
jgi:hypothetical protein